MFLDEDTFAGIVRNTPLISIDLIVQNNHGKILVGKRINRPAKGFWFVPGGRIQKDEKIDYAFERICLSEIGKAYHIKNAKFIGVYQHFYENNFSKKIFSTHYIVLGYKLKIGDDYLPLSNLQHSAYQWIYVSKLLNKKNVHMNTKAYFK
jgi:colanic acid biosynthesis protein WcaH